ncbi:dipeptidyl-peptidase III [Fusarium austroafricanum]|uniref:Dipeptidyl-peptidase III n=1 Tax=Fusarium austroafricanum TaxID=2364996 RepID=A0A8H4NV15_9HYPO|nr:dipeptidyl-peptidase III [Fusarium austroafricanum]
MSYKRSRATYEADFHAPFATFGTPLPDDPDARDDGSFVPVWKQEVRDERGRKRLHGAFTGGWSAGYFNTVGSKEGWTPSNFISSRNNRHKDGAKQAQQRPEDYMDEEDLADAAEAQKVQTSQAFAGLGSFNQDSNATGLMGLLRAEGDTMGLKLLRRMGWKDGQGIGPKIRRSARLELGDKSSQAAETHLFAPDDAKMIQFARKNDRKGLGHDGETKLTGLNPITSAADEDDEDDAHDADLLNTPLLSTQKSKTKPGRGGIGVGILNDNGSDEEDPYEMGPKIRYNRVVGGDKKKKKAKKAAAAANPALKHAPVFVSRTARAGNGLGRCHDGRLPLDGFVLAKITEDLSDLLLEFTPPPVPEGWVSSKTSSDQATPSDYKSTADAAKASTHDAKSRAALLGEKSLPGKSVFDYITSSARDRLATASGNKNLPQGLGEVPEGYSMSEEERQQAVWDEAPKLDRETAIAAISRGSSGPYADNEEKQARYRTYLEHFATGNQPLPYKPKGMAYDDFARELSEFHNCARIFKPMTGFMASRFTTAKKPSAASANGSEMDLVSKPEPKIADPAEEAAKVGMYGNLTRTVQDFYPTRLLCKRFNVRPPAHSQAETEPDTGSGTASRDGGSGPMGGVKMDPTVLAGGIKAIEGITTITTSPAPVPEPAINPDKNEAVEGKTAHDEEAGIGPSVSLEKKTPSPASSRPPSTRTTSSHHHEPTPDDLKSAKEPESHILLSREQSPPPQYPASEPSASRPPPFSSLFTSSPHDSHEPSNKFVTFTAHSPCEAEASGSAAPAYESSSPREALPFDPDQSTTAFRDPVAETKRALPRDTKGDSSRKDDDAEPPPAYSEEGDSPLSTFSFLMAAAGGASSIITQVQQGGPPVSTLGDVGADETIAMDLRGTRFYLSRDELLTLPEFVLLSLFPNGLFPEGQMGGFADGDAVQVDYDPASLQYMLDFFRDVAQSIPTDGSPNASQDEDTPSLGASRDDSKRAGIIVLREDLDFYAIPPRADIDQLDMIAVKRAAAEALQQQNGIFSGLKRSDEPGTTEAHLIEMLTAGGFNHDDRWGHRAGEPNKAVICSLALARLRSDIRGNEMGTNAVGMAQKLLLFWRKPARRCWWEGVELENVAGVEGKLKVWIRRVWTLEMSVIGLR